MITSKIKYLGNLRTENEHLRSGNQIITDAPVDNHGKGEAFSPTDMMSTALANCIFTIMGIKSQKNNFSIKGATAKMVKIMDSNPRKVKEIRIDYDFTMLNLTEDQKELLKTIPDISPVALSLHPDLKQTINIKF